MKVGTDGVLLGAWANIEGCESILDVGTGTGIIALMLAQRSAAIIDALEIDEVAANQARENVEQSPWSDRVQVICDSFQEYLKSGKKYDLIVSNPPYFSNSLLAPDASRTIARHNQKLTTTELIIGATKLLSATGKLSIILPVREYENFRNIAAQYNLYENRQTLIIPSTGKPVKRVLSQYNFEKKILDQTTLVIEKYGRHRYSEEHIALTQEFYLKF
jgi:tRNA1Val (adenine37-N6)-methyltransferase